MREKARYGTNEGTEAQIVAHLRMCDAGFVPALSERIPLDEYARKIVRQAVRFEAWADGELIGLVAAYFNDANRETVYVTNVSVLPEWMGSGSASALLSDCIARARKSGFRRIALEVGLMNSRALALYGKFGFVAGEPRGESVPMELIIEREA
jgi:ribosomal protein S18 acetylase RimI-like enzyme